MRIAAIEEFLGKLSQEDLAVLDDALDVACKKLPEQLIQELGLRTLGAIVKISKMKKGGNRDAEAVEGGA